MEKYQNAEAMNEREELAFASFETAGLEGNSTLRALIIVSSRKIRSCAWSCQKDVCQTAFDKVVYQQTKHQPILQKIKC